MSARTLSRYILLPLAMVFVVVVIIVATVKGIGLPMGSGDYCQVNVIGWQNVAEKVVRIMKGKSGN